MTRDPTAVRGKKVLLSLLASGAIATVLLEVVLAAYFGLVSQQFWRPIYMRSDSVLRWRTEFEAWGAWHRPNATARHVFACFDVLYVSNSYGARDLERPSPGRHDSVIFLGDSMVEGFGVRDDERLSNRFERLAGRPAVNLAAAGDVGPVQYKMIYEQFAPRFAHDAVVVGILPANDLTDNDPDTLAWKDQIYRYRPYYRHAGSGYEVFYKATRVQGRVFSDFLNPQLAGIGPAFVNRIVQNTWVGGFLLRARGQLPARSIDIPFENPDSGYFDTSGERIDAVSWFLGRIAALAAPRQVYVLVIPTYPEVKALRSRQSPWIGGFTRSLQDLGGDRRRPRADFRRDVRSRSTRVFPGMRRSLVRARPRGSGRRLATGV